MYETLKSLIELTILFVVIFDPLMSFAVFFTLTQNMDNIERKKTAGLAVLVATALSYIVLFLGLSILELFSTNLNDFKVAGGIILGILGIRMALGQSIAEAKKMGSKSTRAIAAVIGTPLLTGPAAITAIIVATDDFGLALTGAAISIVMIITSLLLFEATRIKKLIGETAIQVLSTILGLITLAWGVAFVRSGLGF